MLGEFGPENTLFIENEDYKAYECIKNSLIIEMFDRDHVWPKEQDELETQKNILSMV